ncbi:hypothetical protein D3C87_1912590 [compost metagenome]
MGRHLRDEQVVDRVPDGIAASGQAFTGVREITRRVGARRGNVRGNGNADIVEQLRFKRAVVTQGKGQIQFRHGGGEVAGSAAHSRPP